jgi:hypothetical protein
MPFLIYVSSILGDLGQTEKNSFTNALNKAAMRMIRLVHKLKQATIIKTDK